MTVSEYEERFRVSAPSLHETFVAMQGRGARRRRSQRFWAAVALAGVIIVVCTALVSWLPVQAQFLGPTLEFDVDLRKQDLDIIHHTINEQVLVNGLSSKYGLPCATTDGHWTDRHDVRRQ